jgi:hypothetical protein
MSLSTFVNQLPRIFERNTIKERAEKVSEYIRKYSLPAYDTAVSLYGNRDPKAEALKGYLPTIRNLDVVTARTTGALGVIRKRLENALKQMEQIITKSEALFGSKETAAGLTYSKATLIRLIECAQFAEKYSRDFLNFVYVAESIKDLDDDISKPTQREQKSVVNGFQDFMICLAAMGMDYKVLDDYLSKLPDSVVTKISEDTFVATVGAHKIDPLNVRNLTVVWSPIWWVRSVMADWDIARSKAAQAELDLLTARAAYLQRLYEKTNDPKLANEIDSLQARCSDLRLTLDNMEKSYA